MQFLLTQQERDSLVTKGELDATKKALAWCFERLQPKYCPHRKENYAMAFPYCDKCPIDKLRDGQRTMSKLICLKCRQHSK